MTMSSDAPFERPLALRAGTVDHGGFEANADPADLVGVAALFGVPAVDRLQIVGTLERIDGVYRLAGRVAGVVTQTCVVTGEPVTSAIEAPFERYVVVGADPEAGAVDVAFDERDIDYVDEPKVDLGALAVEELALALPAYPRAPDADALLKDIADADERAKPFAVLAERRGAS